MVEGPAPIHGTLALQEDGFTVSPTPRATRPNHRGRPLVVRDEGRMQFDQEGLRKAPTVQELKDLGLRLQDRGPFASTEVQLHECCEHMEISALHGWKPRLSEHGPQAVHVSPPQRAPEHSRGVFNQSARVKSPELVELVDLPFSLVGGIEHGTGQRGIDRLPGEPSRHPGAAGYDLDVDRHVCLSAPG